MARVIGIDYGKQRIGLAVTDPLKIIATPLKTLQNRTIFSFLTTYFQQEPVEAVVIGRPLDLRGQVCEMTHVVDRFVLLFKKRFPHIPIFGTDERFTSVIAQASLVEGGFKRKARKDKTALDRISATLILRSFLVRYNTQQLMPL